MDIPLAEDKGTDGVRLNDTPLWDVYCQQQIPPLAAIDILMANLMFMTSYSL